MGTPPLHNYHNVGPDRVRAQKLSEVYATGSISNLVVLLQANYNGGIHSYLPAFAQNELNQRFNGSYQPGHEPASTWSEYEGRVKELGRFVDVQET